MPTDAWKGQAAATTLPWRVTVGARTCFLSPLNQMEAMISRQWLSNFRCAIILSILAVKLFPCCTGCQAMSITNIHVIRHVSGLSSPKLRSHKNVSWMSKASRTNNRNTFIGDLDTGWQVRFWSETNTSILQYYCSAQMRWEGRLYMEWLRTTSWGLTRRDEWPPRRTPVPITWNGRAPILRQKLGRRS